MMNSKWMLSRRALLGGIGAVALASLTERKAFAQQSPSAKRFIVFYTPEGMWGNAPRPAPGTGSFGPLFEALEPYRQHVTVFRNLNNPSQADDRRKWSSAKPYPDDGHQSAVYNMLTGTGMKSLNEAGGPSVEQVVADAIGGNTPFRSLYFGVRNHIYAGGWYHAFWKAAGQWHDADQDPWNTYNTIFGSFKKPDAKFDLRKSALDSSLRDFESLQSTLPSADRARLEQYHEQLRSIEKRLSTSVSCEAPQLPGKFNPVDDGRGPDVGRLQMDILVRALQCGITNVAGIQWGHTNDQSAYPWLFGPGGQVGHGYSHNTGGSDPDGSKRLKIRRWYAEQLAYLLGELKKVPEGGGTMLDSTSILFASEFGDCNGHGTNDLTWALLGNLGGHFKMGRVVDAQGRAVNDLFASICQAFGANLPNGKFGRADVCQGPLPLT